LIILYLILLFKCILLFNTSLKAGTSGKKKPCGVLSCSVILRNVLNQIQAMARGIKHLAQVFALDMRGKNIPYQMQA